MKRMGVFLSICLIVSLLLMGCSRLADNNQDLHDEVHSSESDVHLQNCAESDVPSEEIFDSPVDLLAFSSMESFTSYLLSGEKRDDIADLASLNNYWLPTGIPEGYHLYKITAGISDIGFWYLPVNCLSTSDDILAAESEQKHFLFISTRGTYEFGSIMTQFGAAQDDLIDGKYLLASENEQIIIWEQDNNTLMLYLPSEYEVSDIRALCAAEEYAKSEDTQSFERVQD